MFYGWLKFLIFYLPFQLAVNPASGVDLASGRVFILLLFFSWAFHGLKNKKLFFSGKPEAIFLSVFLVLSTLSFFAGQNQGWSGRKLMFLFSVFPIYFAASGILDSKEKILKLSRIGVFSGFLAAAVGIFQFLAQFFFGWKTVAFFWGNYATPLFLGKNFSEAVAQNSSWLVNIAGKTYLRSVSVFPDPHMFSFFLGLLIPLALALVFSSPERKQKLFFGTAFATLLLADILTFSRGGYLGILSGALFLAAIFWKKIGGKFKAFSLALVFLLALALIAPGPISQRLWSGFNLKEGSNRGRMEMWKKAAETIERNPLTGVGIGNFPLEVKPLADYREPIYSHNLYLDIAAETGFFGALAWILALLFCIIGFLRKAGQNLFFAFCSASLVVFSVHSLVETPLYSVSVLPLLLVIMSFNRIEINEKGV